jgi:hypothetical protein
LHRLRQAAAGSAQAKTMSQMIQASIPLTAAIKDIGITVTVQLLTAILRQARLGNSKATIRNWLHWAHLPGISDRLA